MTYYYDPSTKPFPRNHSRRSVEPKHKVPHSKQDFARLEAAEAKRQRRRDLRIFHRVPTRATV